jgi:hypothetical protein
LTTTRIAGYDKDTPAISRQAGRHGAGVDQQCANPAHHANVFRNDPLWSSFCGRHGHCRE